MRSDDTAGESKSIATFTSTSTIINSFLLYTCLDQAPADVLSCGEAGGRTLRDHPEPRRRGGRAAGVRRGAPQRARAERRGREGDLEGEEGPAGREEEGDGAAEVAEEAEAEAAAADAGRHENGGTAAKRTINRKLIILQHLFRRIRVILFFVMQICRTTEASSAGLQLLLLAFLLLSLAALPLLQLRLELFGHPLHVGHLSVDLATRVDVAEDRVAVAGDVDVVRRGTGSACFEKLATGTNKYTRYTHTYSQLQLRIP